MKGFDATVTPDKAVQWDLQFHDMICAFCEPVACSGPWNRSVVR